MMKMNPIMFACALIIIALTGCNDQQKPAQESAVETERQPRIREDSVQYMEGGTRLQGYVVYDENQEGKRPAILVVHEWWGLNDYPRSRARQLAELGYIAMAVDMYGEAKNAANPDEALKLASPFYQIPMSAKTRLDGALTKVKTYAQTDTANIAAIGYCFGGFIALNAAKLGSDLKGVVVFHGNLSGAPVNKQLLRAKVLVCHGAADKLVPQQEIDNFKHAMDSIGAEYTFKEYPGATHAFTNPAATELGKKFKMPVEYNAAADTASWNDMKAFLAKIFNRT